MGEELMRCIPSLAVVLLTPFCALAGEWPQWLGPTRDGVSTEKVAPWKAAPDVAWRHKVGEGHSSPVVAGGKLFLHTRRAQPDKQKVFEEVLAAYDAKSGDLLWEKACGDTSNFSSLFGNGPRSTPCVDADRVYSLGVTGLLTCFDVEKGKQLWQKDVLKEFGAKNLFFGVSTSPLIVGDLLLVNVGGKDGASIVAFNKSNGDVAWKKLDDPASYSSPFLSGDGKERQAVFLTDKGLESLRPKDGELLWQYPFPDGMNESATTPVRVGDLVVASTIMSGSVALKLETKDGKPVVKEAWKNPDLTCYFSTPMPVGKEHLYMVTGTATPFNPQATLHCVEASSGKVLWSKPKLGKYHACIIRTANDKLLVLADGGDLLLLEPDPKEYKELAKAKVCGETWAHPALSNGRLYLRDAKELICLDLAK
jgi:outer membrane protein assembly factor BamB